MSADEQPVHRKLRWWFWPVLFAPALFVLTVTAAITLSGPHNFLASLAFMSALPLNFVCSNWTAKKLVLLRDSRGAASPWMFLCGPLIFFLNVALTFGGCSMMEQIAPSPR